MDHIVHIGFVDPHAKGVGRGHDPHPVIEKVLLTAVALLIGKPRMIAGCGKSIVHQQLLDPLHIFAGGTVDNPALIPALFQQFQQTGVLTPGLAHLEEQIGAVKPGDDLRRMPEFQQADNILPHLFGGSGGESPHRRAAVQGADKPGDVQVAGPEILSPLGYAVCLIHYDQRQFQLVDHIQKAVRCEPFRRHIEQLIGPGLQSPEHFPLCGGGLGGVEECRRKSCLFQCRDLILHQGDQR